VSVCVYVCVCVSVCVCAIRESNMHKMRSVPCVLDLNLYSTSSSLPPSLQIHASIKL